MFDDCEHISFASLPGMFEKTITVSSAAKTFSVTGIYMFWYLNLLHVSTKLKKKKNFV